MKGICSERPIRMALLSGGPSIQVLRSLFALFSPVDSNRFFRFIEIRLVRADFQNIHFPASNAQRQASCLNRRELGCSTFDVQCGMFGCHTIWLALSLLVERLKESAERAVLRLKWHRSWGDMAKNKACCHRSASSNPRAPSSFW